MSKPTIVRLERGAPAYGYTFVAINYQNLSFVCWYNGTDVEIEVNSAGMQVSNILNLLYGLFHKDSNFKKKLLKEYSYLKSKQINCIYFRNITDYQFVITKDCDIDNLIRDYYRFHGFTVNENDSEEDIWSRRRKSS